MRIYTKTGDKGQTSLLGGQRVNKNCITMQAIGEIDELNSFLGLLVAELKEKNISGHQEFVYFLTEIQNNLFIVGSQLASLQTKIDKIPQLSSIATQKIEAKIDMLSQQLTELKNFILPGGSILASYCFVVRAICRRAERQIIDLDQKKEVPPEIKIYINRLSDLFFVLARWFNKIEGIKDVEWS